MEYPNKNLTFPVHTAHLHLSFARYCLLCCIVWFRDLRHRVLAGRSVPGTTIFYHACSNISPDNTEIASITGSLRSDSGVLDGFSWLKVIKWATGIAARLLALKGIPTDKQILFICIKKTSNATAVTPSTGTHNSIPQVSSLVNPDNAFYNNRGLDPTESNSAFVHDNATRLPPNFWVYFTSSYFRHGGNIYTHFTQDAASYIMTI